MKPARKFKLGAVYACQSRQGEWRPYLCVRGGEPYGAAVVPSCGSDYCALQPAGRDYYRIRARDWGYWGTLPFETEVRERRKAMLGAIEHAKGSPAAKMIAMADVMKQMYAGQKAFLFAPKAYGQLVTTDLGPRMYVSAPTCDCGAAKANTTHSTWCSTEGNR